MRSCGVGQQLLLIKFRSPDNTYWIKIVRKKGSDAMRRIKIKRCGGGQRKQSLGWTRRECIDQCTSCSVQTACPLRPCNVVLLLSELQLTFPNGQDGLDF